MNSVLVDGAVWYDCADTSRLDVNTGMYLLNCGIKICYENVIPPELESREFTLRFATEQDAIWFVLNYGGRFSGK